MSKADLLAALEEAGPKGVPMSSAAKMHTAEGVGALVRKGIAATATRRRGEGQVEVLILRRHAR